MTSQDSRPCPHCGALVAPCQAPIEEFGPGAICGEWGCALYNQHIPNECPSTAMSRARRVKDAAKDQE